MNISFLKHLTGIGFYPTLVAGLAKQISDDAARTFAVSFYRALGHRKSIKAAFDLACNQLDLVNMPEAHIPKLMHRTEITPGQIFVLKD